ncbi:MAG TPA: hypothetical protein VF662_00850 [Allosphingosinicella sp.]|jgi:hypothetical protein
MARAPNLKVFRMAVGFHDAYVAAPSQKAAAEAWGADLSVFARKEAELVTDPKLTAEPLASPGKVIKRLRGTEAEQIAALGADEDAPPPRAGGAGKSAKGHTKATPTKPPPKPKPRPSRAALEEAEQALEAAEARQREERQAIAEREAALAREREALEKKQRQERERLEARREEAEAAYEEALRRWRES